MTRKLVGVLAVALLAGGLLVAQDKKDVKIKGVLPPNWGKLGLSDKQKQDVYKIQAEYKEKIADLEKQIKDLKTKEKSEMDKVLTAEQKERLKQILLNKAGGGDK